MGARTMLVLAAALLLAEPALALRERAAAGIISHSSQEKYSECWKRVPRRMALTQLGQDMQKVNQTLPGAGLGKIVPFETILKDGMFKVTCVKDYLFTYGDKFGDQKHEYNMGDVSNVSIVHYAAVVPKEDRVPMTPKVCFDFCRTVPDMLFFGILNGRECYCEPYYKPMESDSSECDAVCEGEPTQMCGGKTKSTIWGMHMCSNTAADLDDMKTKSANVSGEMTTLYNQIKDIGSQGQTDAEKLQEIFGQAGDPVASNQMQAVKVQAGVLEHLGEDADALIKDMEADQGKITQMEGTDFTKFDEATKAEALIADMKEQVLASKEIIADMEAVLADHFVISKIEDSAAPQVDPVDRKKSYYPVMYFVDKAHEEEMSTCDGDIDGVPLMGMSMDECAVTCDAHIHTCVAFQYYSEGEGICVLFSKLKSITHYTGCEVVEGFSRFLQTKKATKKNDENPLTCLDGMVLEVVPHNDPVMCPEAIASETFYASCDAVGPGEYCEADGECGTNDMLAENGLGGCGGWEDTYRKEGHKTITAKCVAKFSKFSGLNLTPQGSGKCDLCLKKVTKADRCYQ